MNLGGDRGDSLRAATPRFEDFSRERWHDAVRLARSLTGSTAAAEDIVQEVYGRMYLSWGRADEPAAYLRVSLVNSCRSWHRRRELERVRLPMLISTNPGAGEPDELSVVKALPSRQRAVVMMRYWGDLSEAEIAEELGCAPGTVKSLASRARERLAVAIAS